LETRIASEEVGEMAGRQPASAEPLDALRASCLDRLDELDHQRRRLIAALEELGRGQARFRERLQDDSAVFSEIYLHTAALRGRDELFDALHAFNAAVKRFRACAVRVMVDGERLSMSAVARRLGRSRQFLQRIYEGEVAAP
jgi:hypothetical protein